MTSKLLQIVGVLMILGLVGGAIAGFSILKDRIRVVVQNDDTDLGPDPTALLRDDVQVLARDVVGLQQAVAQNFEQLASGIERGAATRHGDVAALRQQVARQQAELQGLTGSVARLSAQLEAWQATAKAAAAKGDDAQPADTVAIEPISSAAIAAAPAAVQPAPVEPAAVEPDVPATAIDAAPAKTTGFLSFDLPSTRLAFDEPQDYTLLPQLCRVGFDAKSTLHDFTGVTSAVSGRFRADFDDPQGLCSGEVVVMAAELKTGVDGRDSNMWEYLDSTNHKEIRFAIERFQAAPDGVDVAKKQVRGEVVGKMTIRGKTRAFTMPATIEVDPQQRVVITGQQKLLLSDYDVPVPSQLGVINMQDEVVVWVALRARAQAQTTRPQSPRTGK